MFHRRERMYESNMGISERYYEIIPPEVTLSDRLDVIYNSKGIQPRDLTVFDEIKIVPYDKICSDEEWLFGSEDIKAEPMSITEYIERAFDAFKLAILSKWDSEKFHVVMHSSGYDSRLVSWAIRALYDEFGDNHMGSVLFLNNYWEAEQFKQIMEYEGWDDSQYVVFNEFIKDPLMIYEGSFNFDIAWKHLNGGMIAYPVNANYEPITWCQNEGFIPTDNIQCIGGAGSNEIARTLREGKRIGWYFDWIYYHALSTFPLKGRDWIFPFLNFDFIRTVIKYNDTIDKNGISKQILDVIAPKLQKIDRISVHHLMKKGHLQISNNLVDKAYNNYKNSWYYKTIGTEVNPIGKFEYSTWWGLWNLASFCDHLVNSGVKINVKGS